jgi:hypothetical protein
MLAVSGLTLLSWNIYSIFSVERWNAIPAAALTPAGPQPGPAAGAWRKDPVTAASTRAIDSLKDDVAKLQQRLSDLDRMPDIILIRSKLDELTHAVARLSATNQSPPSAQTGITEGTTEDEWQSPDEALALAEEQHREQIDVIETSFQSEYMDDQWSDIAADAIEQALTQEEWVHLPAVTECRVTLCKIELSHQNRQQIEMLMLTLPSVVGGLLPRMTVDQVEYADDSMSTIVYLAREGHDFPGPDQFH